MKRQIPLIVTVVLIAVLILLGLRCVSAAPLNGVPAVTDVDPASAPNDLNTSIVITGTGFTAELSGMVVITPPTAYLGDAALVDMTWVSSATLHAVVPWGMDPDVYTLTVVNPGGEVASLSDAFTVTRGIGEWSTGGPYGGWVESLALGDSQGEIVYAIVKNVGLFRSRDGGANWDLIFIEIGHENQLEVDPTNPDRLYISKPHNVKGTAGLYRSEDGGDTWALLPPPIPGTSAGFYAFVNPHHGTLFGALSSDPLGPTCEYGCGLFRFDELNQTWIRLEENGLLDETTPVSAVGFDPEDPDTMYAGLIGGLVLESIDGGETWSSLGQTPLDYIKRLVVNPVGRAPWVCGPGAQLPGGLYRYDGDQWISMYSSPQPSANVRNLVFDPSAADVDTQSIWIAACFDGVLKSEDGGQSWTLITPMRSEAIALNPSHPQTIYSGSNEGIAKTDDGGASWQIVNEGLTGIVPYHMGVSPHTPAVVYGVADSIGIFGSRNGGETWERLTISTGGPIVVDPVHPLHVVNANYGELLVADDGWNFDRTILIPPPDGMPPEDYLFVPTSLIARPAMWVMGVGYGDWSLSYWNYAGGGGIYLSPDGEDWTLITPLLDCPPTSLAFDPVDENILYAVTSGHFGGATCDGTFLRSTDGGQTWHESAAGLPPGWAHFMAIEPTAPYRIFLDIPFVSWDQGVTWTEIDQTGLPGGGANALLILDGSPSILYMGTSAGLFRSSDGAQTWLRAQGALGQLEIWSMAGTTIDDRQVLYVATIGGAVESDELQAQGLAGDPENLINAGVYRYTMLPSLRIYLPLVLR